MPNVLSVVAPLKQDGAPIEFVIPDTTTGNEFVVLMSKGTASPNAAWCLYDYLFTPEGQTAFTGSVSASTIGPIGDVPELPANYVNPRITQLAPVQQKLLTLLGLQ